MMALPSAHFTEREFACPCCGRARVDGKLIEALEQLRQKVDKPLLITSGYRCSAHNAKVGGAKSSEHVEGLAADVKCPGASLEHLYAASLLVPEFAGGGIGLYPQEGFLHLDVRGRPARWARLNGKYASIKQGLKALKESRSE